MKRIVSVVLAGVMGLSIMTASVGCAKRGPKIDKTKTQLYVSNYNGGQGTAWLDTENSTDDMIGRFEERLNGDLGKIGENTFSDVKKEKWYTDYVIWAAEKGVVEGYPDGTFRPKNVLTREEFALLLYRLTQNEYFTQRNS